MPYRGTSGKRAGCRNLGDAVKTLGLDEAGRGCVLGPLVIGGFLVEDAELAQLSGLGAADSKTLTAARREAARARLQAVGVEWVATVEPSAIDAGNMNELEEAVIVRAIRELRPDRVVIDALGHPSTIPRTVERLRAAVGFPVAIVMEPKADANHSVVGAASLVAKTTRDARLALDTAGVADIGSGYPSDPKTRAWIAAHHQTGQPWPSFVRTRWGTIRELEHRLPLP